MLNEQLTCMTLYSHIDQPGLSWRTRPTQTYRDILSERPARIKEVVALR
jgi:hypothetical protein